MTFKRPSTDRQLTFEEIAAETRLPVNEVELLVMKALAQGLVKGAIDQVDGRVHMTWVQPRVLDKQQVGIDIKNCICVKEKSINFSLFLLRLQQW